MCCSRVCSTISVTKSHACKRCRERDRCNDQDFCWLKETLCSYYPVTRPYYANREPTPIQPPASPSDGPREHDWWIFRKPNKLH